MNVYIIFCNDAAKFAVLKDKDEAMKKLKELRVEDFKRNKNVFNNASSYEDKFYWHIRVVAGA